MKLRAIIRETVEPKQGKLPQSVIVEFLSKVRKKYRQEKMTLLMIKI